MKKYKAAIRTHIVIPEYLKTQVQNFANSRGVSMSNVVNDAIKEFLKHNRPTTL